MAFPIYCCFIILLGKNGSMKGKGKNGKNLDDKNIKVKKVAVELFYIK